eukprot:gene15084-23034_t
MFYLLKYLSKEVTAVENTLVVFKKAFELAQRFPSRAEDRDTDAVLRSKKLLMTRFGTRHLGAVEVSAQVAFAAILDHPSEYCSHDFAGVFVWAAVKYLCGPANCVDGDEVSDKDYGSSDSEEADTDEEVDVDLAADAAANPVDMPEGNTPVYVDPPCMRKPNLRVEFEQPSSLAEPHVQVLRSKLMVPLLFGPRCPKPMSTAPANELKARQHARYMTALFRPWTFRDGAFWEGLTGPCKQWTLNVATLLRSDCKGCGDTVAKTKTTTSSPNGEDAEAVLQLREDIAVEDPETLFLNGLQDALASFKFPEPASVTNGQPGRHPAATDSAARRKDLLKLQELERDDDAPLNPDALNANPFQPAEKVVLEDGLPQAPPELDAAQKAAFDAVVSAVLVMKDKPRLLLLHGGPGCGKSFVMRHHQIMQHRRTTILQQGTSQ